MALQDNWLTEGLIDYEFKKYTLLAYFEEVKRLFGKHKLYPSLSDLLSHYRNLQVIKKDKKSLNQGFPKELKGLNADQLKLIYEKMIHDDSLMQEIEQIMDFAIPVFKEAIEEGKELYDFLVQIANTQAEKRSLAEEAGGEAE